MMKLFCFFDFHFVLPSEKKAMLTDVGKKRAILEIYLDPYLRPESNNLEVIFLVCQI